jgi:hypothetical protein
MLMLMLLLFAQHALLFTCAGAQQLQPHCVGVGQAASRRAADHLLQPQLLPPPCTLLHSCTTVPGEVCSTGPEY